MKILFSVFFKISPYFTYSPPAGISHLDPGLADVDGDDLPHGGVAVDSRVPRDARSDWDWCCEVGRAGKGETNTGSELVMSGQLLGRVNRQPQQQAG